MRYQPLKTTRGVVGVLGVKPVDPSRHLTREQLRTLDAFANQIGLAIERASLAEQARQAELLEVTDKLQTALLNSISHDLRTPLVSITGALSSLADDQIILDESARRSLIETAGEEADRLNRLVGNLLDMTRLESGAMRIKKEACDIQDLVGSALEELGGRLGNRSINIDIPRGFAPDPIGFCPDRTGAGECHRQRLEVFPGRYAHRDHGPCRRCFPGDRGGRPRHRHPARRPEPHL